jgi:chromosome partitioning protein
MAKRYTYANQKGGVAKTYTTLASVILAWLTGKRALLVDLDIQSNSTLSSGCNPERLHATVYDLMQGKASFQEVVKEIYFDPKTGVFFDPSDAQACAQRGVTSFERTLKCYDLLPITLDASEADVELQADPEWGKLLNMALNEVDPLYDEIHMDTKPGLGKLTFNGICAATDIVIPTAPDGWSTQGMIRLAKTIMRAKKMKPELAVAGILFTRYRYKNHREVMEQVKTLLVPELNRQFPGLELSWFETIIEEGAPFGEALNANSNVVITRPDSTFALEYLSYYAELLKKTDGRGIEEVKRKFQQLYTSYQSKNKKPTGQESSKIQVK